MVNGRPKFICIVGIDGSGKTTVAKKLVNELRSNGHSAEYVWCRFESRALARALKAYHAVFSRDSAPDARRTALHRRDRTRKRALFRVPLVRIAYERFVTLSYLGQIRRLVAMPLQSGSTLVCDRYIHDTVVDLALDLRYPEGRIHEVTEQFYRRAPKPDIIIFIDVRPSVAFARKDDVPDLEYLSTRYEQYQKLSSNAGFLRIDGEQPPEKVLADTTSALFPLLEAHSK